MQDWLKSGVIGSLRRKVTQDVKSHLRENRALSRAKAPIRMRFLMYIFANRSLSGFLLLYATFLTFVVLLEISHNWHPIIKDALEREVTGIASLFRGVTGYLLAAQVTTIGLLFPIAVGLITLIVQREDASSTASDIQVYYHESLAFRIGASGLSLSIILTLHLVWPNHLEFSSLPYDISTEISQILLTAIHLLWLTINLAALWHFLTTSLLFVRPSERALMRRRFAAYVSIPQNLTNIMMQTYYLNASKKFSSRSNGAESIDEGQEVFFSRILADHGEAEVTIPDDSDRVLHDVWMRPLCWAANSWISRCNKTAEKSGNSAPRLTLMFTPEPGRPPAADGAICRRQGGLPLNRLERIAIRYSFRFKPKRE